MAQARQVAWPRRGEVYLVGFDPSLGAEIKKTRPALVLQNDIGNRYSDVTIVAAITSKATERIFPVQVPVEPPEGGLERASVVQLNQIRSIDKQRLLRRLGRLGACPSNTLRPARRLFVDPKTLGACPTNGQRAQNQNAYRG